MARAIFVDSCAFDYLFLHRIDVDAILKDSEFKFVVTAAVLEELAQIPENTVDPDKRNFIAQLSKGGSIAERGYFSLGVSGLSCGDVLAGLPQMEYLSVTADQLGAPRKSGNPKNATDRMLLSHAIIDAVVTAEKVLGNRVLMDEALKRGATVIGIKGYDPAKEDFVDFLRRHFSVP